MEDSLINSGNFCRTCRTGRGEFNIYSDKGIEMQLAERINTYLPITVSIDDNLPLSLCSICVQHLESCHQLVVACLETKEFLSKVNKPNYFHNYCRTCGADMGEVMIYSEEGIEMQLAERINAFLPITVSEEDDLPLILCSLCVGGLESCHYLVVSCLEMDQHLKLQKQINEAETYCKCKEEGIESTSENGDLTSQDLSEDDGGFNLDQLIQPQDRKRGASSMPSRPEKRTKYSSQFDTSVCKLQSFSEMAVHEPAQAEEDQYDMFANHLVCQMRELPIQSFLLLQQKFQKLLTQERLNKIH